MNWYMPSLAQCAPWSYVLLLGQVFLLSMLVERFVFLKVKSMIRADVFLQQLHKLVVAGNADRGMKLCAAAGEIPLARVCQAGLAARGQGAYAMEEELKRATAAQVPRINRRLKVIPVVGIGVALVGIAGSVMLGAGDPIFGGGGPLPFGLAMPFAPAMLGVVSAVVALMAWLSLSASARSMVQTLDKAKQMLLELG